MTHATEPGSVLAAADEAAEAGDLETAERLLREALALQEAKLGLTHPDLAETLNNLAIVCEGQEKYTDAEQNYRRAHAIAIAALKPGDPAVATSLKNLVDFCVSRGIPIWMPPAAVTNGVTAPPPQPATPPADPAPVSQEAPEAVSAVRSGRPTQLVAIVALSVAALLAVVLFAWRGPGRSTEASLESTPTAVPERAPAALPTRPPVTASGIQPAAPAPDATPRKEPPKAASGRRVAETAASDPVSVVVATLCSAFENRGSPDWQCTPATGSAPAGVFTFYTRLKSATDTTVEHRWYRNDRLHQAVKLAVRANPGSGYRTYSRAVIPPDRAGDWRVELRAADGTLLKEERLVVR